MSVRKSINRVCFGIIVALIAFFTVQSTRPLWPKSSSKGRLGDYTLNVNSSKATCEQLRYPRDFVHPLPTVLLWRTLDSVGSPAGPLIWLMIVGASVLASLVLTRDLQGGGKEFFGVEMALAFIAVEYYLVWEFKVSNINAFYLLLVLLGCRFGKKKWPVLAGAFFAASVTVRVYSAVFLIYFLLRRQWRAAFSMVFFLIFFFVAIPSLYFGPRQAISLNQNWLSTIRSASDPSYRYPAYNVSLQWTAQLLTSSPASGGKVNIVDLDPGWTIEMVNCARCIWCVLILAYFVKTRAARARTLPPNENNSASLLDVAVLLICPLPLSPVLQPHHLVVLLVPALCLVHTTFDSRQSRRTRFIAGFALAAGFCLTEFGPRYPLRGVGVLLTCLLDFFAIWAIRVAEPALVLERGDWTSDPSGKFSLAA